MKIGDRVRIVNSPYSNPKLQPGCYGTIVEIESGYYDIVTDDRFEDEEGDYLWPFVEKELEVTYE